LFELFFSQIGHETEAEELESTEENVNIDEQLKKINAELEKYKKNPKLGKNYANVLRCIIFHENILSFCNEIQDIFKGPIFAQFTVSCIIICMTCVLIVSQLNNPAALAGSINYLMAMIAQVFYFCWAGNELIHSVSSI
jgi:hypothetical protein